MARSTALALSGGNIRALAKKAHALQTRARNATAKFESKVETVVETLEATGGAYAMGVLQGRFPDKREIMGIPIELAIGAGLHVAGFAGLAGRSSSHLHAFGTGALAAYAVRAGQVLGQKMSTGAKVSGMLDDSGSDVLSPDELDALAE